MKGTCGKTLGMELKIWRRNFAVKRSLMKRINRRKMVATINGDVRQNNWAD